MYNIKCYFASSSITNLESLKESQATPYQELQWEMFLCFLILLKLKNLNGSFTLTLSPHVTSPNLVLSIYWLKRSFTINSTYMLYSTCISITLEVYEISTSKEALVMPTYAQFQNLCIFPVFSSYIFQHCCHLQGGYATFFCKTYSNK